MQKLVGVLMNNNMAISPHNHHLNRKANKKEKGRSKETKTGKQGGFGSLTCSQPVKAGQASSRLLTSKYCWWCTARTRKLYSCIWCKILFIHTHTRMHTHTHTHAPASLLQSSTWRQTSPSGASGRANTPGVHPGVSAHFLSRTGRPATPTAR